MFTFIVFYCQSFYTFLHVYSLFYNATVHCYLSLMFLTSLPCLLTLLPICLFFFQIHNFHFCFETHLNLIRAMQTRTFHCIFILSSAGAHLNVMTTFSMNLTVAKSSAARSLLAVSGSFLCDPHASVYSCCESVITMTVFCSKDIICNLSPIFYLFHLFCPIFCNVILVFFCTEPSSITYSEHLVKFLHPLSLTGKNLF